MASRCSSPPTPRRARCSISTRSACAPSPAERRCSSARASTGCRPVPPAAACAPGAVQPGGHAEGQAAPAQAVATRAPRHGGPLFRRDETTSFERLRQLGFSEPMIDCFFRPFFGGIFLERELVTSSRMLEFVFRMMSEGDGAALRWHRHRAAAALGAASGGDAAAGGEGPAGQAGKRGARRRAPARRARGGDRDRGKGRGRASRRCRSDRCAAGDLSLLLGSAPAVRRTAPAPQRGAHRPGESGCGAERGRSKLRAGGPGADLGHRARHLPRRGAAALDRALSARRVVRRRGRRLAAPAHVRHRSRAPGSAAAAAARAAGPAQERSVRLRRSPHPRLGAGRAGRRRSA